MGVISTATLIVLGVGAVVVGSGAVIRACTKDDIARENIKTLQAENQALATARNYIENIKNKLVTAKGYLEDGQKDFNDGGHIIEPPFASTEFKDCDNKLEDAIKNAENLIDDFNETIKDNNELIKKEKAKL